MCLYFCKPTGGLQVEVEKNVWIDARPIEGYFVVNIGEMLQIMTGGYYKATPHRVLSPPSSIENKARLSIPYFWNPRLDFAGKRRRGDCKERMDDDG